VTIRNSSSADGFLAEIERVKETVFDGLDAEAIPGEDLSLKRANLGGVSHEVGTMRMGGTGGVVDPDLRMRPFENLYVCDLSVFPTSPAANPSLTLAALAQRLAGRMVFGS
jgi:choline dehydrogenase-like flavoprotein